MAEIIRMATPIYPIMDNIFVDFNWFFVPHRLVWEHWQAFWGENEDPWTQSIEYEIPQIEAPENGWTVNDIAKYMGLPMGVDNISVNALPFRAYVKIWNDFYRDENLKSCAHMYTDETTRTGQTGEEVNYSYVTGAELGGLPLKAAKFHGLFTSCLPSPQKGPAVKIPLGTSARVITGEKEVYKTNEDVYPLRWGTATLGTISSLDVYKRKYGSEMLNNNSVSQNSYDIEIKNGNIHKTAGTLDSMHPSSTRIGT